MNYLRGVIIILNLLFLSGVQAQSLGSAPLKSDQSNTTPHSILNKNQSKILNTLEHQGQALLMMMVVTGIELVRQQIEVSGLKKESIPYGELLKHSGEAAEHLINGGSTWMSFLGAGASSGLTAKPVEVINNLIQNTNTRPIFKNLLQSGIASLATFSGWELGAQLWDEARSMVKNESDYERADKLGSMSIGAFKSMFSNDPKNARDSELLKTMFKNMFNVLVTDSDKRNQLLYNTWRHRLATGHFISLVSAMSAAGVVGKALFPASGKIAQLMFGVAGGAATLFIPDKINDGISDKIANARSSYNEGNFKSNLNQLDGLKQKPSLDDGSFRKEFDKVSSQIIKSRDATLTPQFEILYRQYKHIMALEGKRATANKYNNGAAEKKIQVSLDEYKSKFKKQLSKITDTTLDQLLRVTKVPSNRTATAALVRNFSYVNKTLNDLKTKINKDDKVLFEDSTALALVKINRLGFNADNLYVPTQQKSIESLLAELSSNQENSNL